MVTDVHCCAQQIVSFTCQSKGDSSISGMRLYFSKARQPFKLSTPFCHFPMYKQITVLLSAQGSIKLGFVLSHNVHPSARNCILGKLKMLLFSGQPGFGSINMVAKSRFHGDQFMPPCRHTYPTNFQMQWHDWHT